MADAAFAFPPRLAQRVVGSCGPAHGSCHGLGATFTDVHLVVSDQCYNTNTGVVMDALHTAKNPLYALYGRPYDYDDAPIRHTPGALLTA